MPPCCGKRLSMVRGMTEPDAAISFRGEVLKVAPDGAFEASVVPVHGVNEITISAEDAAGNRTERTRAFVHRPAGKATVVYDPDLPRLGPLHFVTNRSPLTLSGTTEANARIGVRSSAGPLRASAFSDAKGRFVLTVPLAGEREDLALSVTALNGVVTEDEFQVSVDREAPRIQADAEPPPVTGTEWLTLSGSVEPDAQLTLNGKEIGNAGGRFEERIELVAGPNRIEMQATDRVGNTGIERWQVSLDQDPPELAGQRVEPKQVEKGGRLTVEVTARDRSGLRQAAQVTVAVGGEVFTDYLRLSEAERDLSRNADAAGGGSWDRRAERRAAGGLCRQRPALSLRLIHKNRGGKRGARQGIVVSVVGFVRSPPVGFIR